MAGQKVLAARQSIVQLINAAHDEEVVMGGSTTGLILLLAQAILPSLRGGDEIIVTNCDHEANARGWMCLQQAGAVVKVWEVDQDSLELRLADLERLLSRRTKWVAMTHASNVLGTPNPVAEVAALAHATGARPCGDGVAYAPPVTPYAAASRTFNGT